MKKTILALTLALSLQGLVVASAADNDYIMCPGDQLQVVVYGHEDLSSPPNSNTTPYTVRPDGKVTFPLIGDIDVTGKTVTEFTRQLEASLAEYLVRPQVSVNILKLGTTRVYVLGEVKNRDCTSWKKPPRIRCPGQSGRLYRKSRQKENLSDQKRCGRTCTGQYQ